MYISRAFIITLITAIIVAGLLLLAYFLAGYFKNGPEAKTDEPQVKLAPEIEGIIKGKADTFRPILRDDKIIAAIKASNDQHRGITTVEILELDRRFQSPQDVGFAKQFQENSAANKLIEFQEGNPAFSEIFITDKFGLNVAQTNKTSDFYQADEEWWTGSYNDGKGREYHGAIEFDESAQAEAISVYIPVFDAESNELIGIAKAVLHIAAIKLEL